MVQSTSRQPRRRTIALLTLSALLLSLSLAACSSPESESVVPTPTATLTPTPAVLDSTSTRPPTLTPPSADPSPASSTEPSEPAQPEETTSLDPAAFSAEVDALVGDVDGLIEIVVALPDGTTLAEVNSYEPMEAASLYKLAIMVELFVQREMGDLAFDEEVVLNAAYFSEEDSVFSEDDIGVAVTIETLLQTMITLSSNVAATALLDQVGNENVNLTMASLGLTATEIRWTPGHVDEEPIPEEEEPVIEEPEEPVEEEPVEEPTVEEQATEEPAFEEEPTEDAGSTSSARTLLRVPASAPLFDLRADAALNVTTAADIAALYLMLVNGQLVSESASQEMLVLLEDQQINDRLPAYLPDGSVVAHKTGNLDGLVHDAGVVFAPAGPIIVVVLTEDVAEWQAVDLIATIGRLAYDAGS